MSSVGSLDVDGAPDPPGREGGAPRGRHLPASGQAGRRRPGPTRRPASSPAPLARRWSTQRCPTSSTVWWRSTTSCTSRWFTLVGLRQRYASMTHWPDTLTTDLVLRLADGRSESVGETRIRYLCWAMGLPAPQVNYPIVDENGREVARVDLAWPELGVFLEFERQGEVRGIVSVTETRLRRRGAGEAAGEHDPPPHRLAVHPCRLGRPLHPAADGPEGARDVPPGRGLTVLVSLHLHLSARADPDKFRDPRLTGDSSPSPLSVA